MRGKITRYDVNLLKLEEVAEMAGGKRKLGESLGHGETYYYKLRESGATKNDLITIQALYGIDIIASESVETADATQLLILEHIARQTELLEKLVKIWGGSNDTSI